jgi:hypothetical protein
VLSAVRKACLPAIWSQGVKLARENAVSKVSEGKGEIVVRVRAGALPVPPTVTLYTEEEEWSCDCAGKVDPCAHVAAAAIAFEGGNLPAAAPASTSSTSSHVGYRLTSSGGRLNLTRVLVEPTSETPIRGSIVADSFRAKHPSLAPTHDDLRIDRVMALTSREQIPLDRMVEVLDALSSPAAAGHATLDGKPVKASNERIKPIATVQDAANGGGFTLRVDKDPRVKGVVGLGVALVDGVLRPLGEVATTGERLERLPLVRTFARHEETELVTRVIPELEKTIEVAIKTTRLAKKSVHARPRLVLDLSHVEGHTLSVLPLLMYGDPPIARIDGDQVTSIGTGEVPVRRIDQERILVQRLRGELNRVLGRRVHF